MKPTPNDPTAMFEWSFHAAREKFANVGNGKQTRPPAIFLVSVYMDGAANGKPFARMAQTSFLVESPGAKVDASSIEVHPRQGDLVVSLRVQIERPGRYWAGAELWGGRDGATPIAFAQRPLGDLAVGPNMVRLEFGGQILRDIGVDGPYTLRNIHLNQMDTVPPHQAQAIDSITTPDFRASEFGGT